MTCPNSADPIEAIRGLEARLKDVESTIDGLRQGLDRLFTSSPPDAIRLLETVRVAVDGSMQLSMDVQNLVCRFGLAESEWRDAEELRELIRRIEHAINEQQASEEKKRFALDLAGWLDRMVIRHPVHVVEHAWNEVRIIAICSLRELSNTDAARLPGPTLVKAWLENYTQLTPQEQDGIGCTIRAIVPSLADLLTEFRRWSSPAVTTLPEAVQGTAELESPSDAAQFTSDGLGDAAPLGEQSTLQPSPNARNLNGASGEAADVIVPKPAKALNGGMVEEAPARTSSEDHAIQQAAVSAHVSLETGESGPPPTVAPILASSAPPRTNPASRAELGDGEPDIVVMGQADNPPDEEQILDACQHGDYLRAVLLAAAALADHPDENNVLRIRFDSLVLAHEVRTQRRQVDIPPWATDADRVRGAPRIWVQFAFLATVRACSTSPFLSHMLSAAEDEYLSHFSVSPSVAQWLDLAWETAKVPGLWDQVITVPVDRTKAWRIAMDQFCTEFESNIQSKPKGAYARRQKRYMCSSITLRSLYAAVKSKDQAIKWAPIQEYLNRPPESLVADWIISTGRVKTVDLTDYQRAEVELAAEQFLQIAKNAMTAARASTTVPQSTSNEEIVRIRNKLHGLRLAAIAAAADRPWHHLFQEIVDIACPSQTS